MNLATLEVSKEQARESLIHYRRAVRERSNAEYDQICRGLTRIMRGQRLIELSKVIAAGGADGQHRPRLAIMRADQKAADVYAPQDGSVRFSAVTSSRSRSLTVRFPVGTLPRWEDHRGRRWFSAEGRSIIPLIPPQYMPKGALSRYHILWEATWEDVPSDPALLQHIGGDLWAVLAVWDLSPLERAVLAGRGQA